MQFLIQFCSVDINELMLVFPNTNRQNVKYLSSILQKTNKDRIVK